MAGNFALSVSLKFLSIFAHISHHWVDHSDLGIIIIWTDLFLLQKLSIEDDNFNQRWRHQKWNKGKGLSWVVTGGKGVNGLKNLNSKFCRIPGIYRLALDRFATCITKRLKKYGHGINPLTPAAFCQKDILEIFRLDMGQISSNLLEKPLQLDSMPFFPLASCFRTFLLRHVQKSKFWVFGWESDLCLIRLFVFFFYFHFLPFLFLLFLSFSGSDWPSTRLASHSKTSERQHRDR